MEGRPLDERVHPVLQVCLVVVDDRLQVRESILLLAHHHVKGGSQQKCPYCRLAISLHRVVDLLGAGRNNLAVLLVNQRLFCPLEATEIR